jgi:stage II sporulation protein D
MRGHIGGLIGVAAALAFLPLSCRLGKRQPVTPEPPVPSAPQAIALRPVRVLLAADATEIRVAISAAYEVRRPSAGETLDRAASLPESLALATPIGFRIGDRDYPGEVLDLAPISGGLVAVEGQRYRGTLRLLRRPGSAFHVVNVLPLEPYLASVINGEMPAHWPAEALKAQAVAARSYALYQMQHRPADAVYDLRADEWSQVYLGLASETSRSRRLVAETAGIVLTYGGRVLCAYYSSTCGGHTQDGRYVFEDGGIPPLAGVPCPYCAGSKYFRWERTLSMRDLSAAVSGALLRQGRAVGAVTALQVLQRAPSGHVARIKVVGSAGAVAMRGKAFRHAVGTRRLPSTRFQIHPASGGLRFTGGGFGHGVGMCQVGAKGAAEAGLDFQQILQYYYPHSTAVRLSAPSDASRIGRDRGAPVRRLHGVGRRRVPAAPPEANDPGGRGPKTPRLGDKPCA